MKACPQQIMIMQTILNDYVTSTGLHIKYNKSLMVPINVAPDRAILLAWLLGCSIGKIPFTYLGLPLGTTKPTVLEMMPLVDRIERRMTANFMMMAYSGSY